MLSFIALSYLSFLFSRKRAKDTFRACGSSKTKTQNREKFTKHIEIYINKQDDFNLYKNTYCSWRWPL